MLGPSRPYLSTPQVSKIVMQACVDFGLPYHHYNSWGHAVVAHYEYLKEMGRRLAEP